MLVLTIEIGKSIKIDDDITVTALQVKGNQVKLGIDAPDEVAINREELYVRMVRETGHNVSLATK